MVIQNMPVQKCPLILFFSKTVRFFQVFCNLYFFLRSYDHRDFIATFLYNLLLESVGVFYPELKNFITLLDGVFDFVCDAIVRFVVSSLRFLRCKTIYTCHYRFRCSFHLFLIVGDSGKFSKLMIQKEEES